jgi:DNA-directed RNA polymerase specialized sigma24 family protein
MPFPSTQPSVVHALASSDAGARERAFDTIVTIYWKPVYKYIRLRWTMGHEDCEDHTQDFFRLAFEKEWLARYDAGRARFRTFLRTCVDGHVSNSRRAERRAKRGGGFTFVAMDFASAEREFLEGAPPPDADVEAYFHHEWVRAVFEHAVARLRAECDSAGKEVPFRLFVRYDVEPARTDARPSYAELAREFALPETQVTNFLAFARRRFRHHVLAALAELTGNQEEYGEAVRDLLGVTAP